MDALILPGGESTTMSRLLVAFDLMEPLRARLAEGMPAYGSCAGMILLGRDVLDGRPDQQQLAALDVVVRRNAFGRQVHSFEADLEVEGFQEPFTGVFIRAPFFEDVGPGVEVLSRVGDRVIAARGENILVTAFHPELTDDARFHEYFLREVCSL